MDRSPPHLYRARGLNAGVPEPVLDSALAQTARNTSRGVLPILSLKHLAQISGAPYVYLREIVQRIRDPYTDLALRKPRGGVRPISAPEPMLMDVQRVILRRALRSLPHHPSSFAYQSGKSIVDCAWQHAGARWLIKLDLHSFFDRINERQVYRVFREQGFSNLVSLELARLCTRVPHDVVHQVETKYTAIPTYAVNAQGHLPQGGPTSGAISNAVATPLDHDLNELAMSHRLVYSRYSDDLVFSSSRQFDRTQAKSLVQEAGQVIRHKDYVLHDRKTRIVSPGARHVVLGLLVGDDRVRLLPEFRRRVEVHIRGVRKFGLQQHAAHRGFRSAFSFVSHVDGCLAFALAVEPEWAHVTGDAWRDALSRHGFPAGATS